VETVEVTATIPEKPVLVVTGGPLAFTGDNGVVSPSGVSIQVGFINDTSGTVWSATKDQAWITVNPVGGSGSRTVDVSVDVTGLGSGSHTGHVMIESACALGSPVPVDVTLDNTMGGTIQVTTDPASATYSITGPNGYSETGTGGSEYTGVEAGDYTIHYDVIGGHKTPGDETRAVVAGEVTAFTGTYVDLRELNNVIVSIGGMKPNESMVDEARVYYGDPAVPYPDKYGDANYNAVHVANDTELYGEGTVTAAGDVDGDGTDEIIVSHADGVVSGYTGDGVKLAAWVDFHPFGFASGVDLAVGDVDGDGVGEIIVGAGADADEPAVRVYAYDGLTGWSDTGISFLAYAGGSGLKVAAGDVDGDGVDEILTAPRGSSKVPATVRVWKACPACAGGVADAGGFVAGVSLSAVDLAAGDVDGDGVDEIIVASQPGKDTKTIATYRYRATPIPPSWDLVFPPFEVSVDMGYETSIAAGDTDYDGTAEVVCSDVDASGTPVARMYTAQGQFLQEIQAFAGSNIENINVSFGQVVGQ
jgi:hypothetical protein